jgi:hypothetical protein
MRVTFTGEDTAMATLLLSVMGAAAHRPDPPIRLTTPTTQPAYVDSGAVGSQREPSLPTGRSIPAEDRARRRAP